MPGIGGGGIVSRISKVSVISPVFNAEKYLGECLDSVLGQTLKDIEVICVDDGSSDGSAAVLSEYAAKDPRVKVLTQQNAGSGPARNHGMDMATGECVAFMDPDDKYPDEGVLECLYAALGDSGCAIAGGRPLYFPPDFPGIAELARVADAKAAFPRFGVVDFREYQWPYRFWCYIFRRSLLDGIRFPALRTFQDVPFFVMAMAKARRFLAVDRITYAYRQHEGNGTRNLSDVKKNERLVGIRMVMDIAVKYRYWRMFDHMRWRFGANGRKFGFGSWRLFSIVGLRNEVIYRFRKLFGLSHKPGATR